MIGALTFEGVLVIRDALAVLSPDEDIAELHRTLLLAACEQAIIEQHRLACEASGRQLTTEQVRTLHLNGGNGSAPTTRPKAGGRRIWSAF